MKWFVVGSSLVINHYATRQEDDVHLTPQRKRFKPCENKKEHCSPLVNILRYQRIKRNNWRNSIAQKNNKGGGK